MRRKKTNKSLYLALFIIAIMVLSIFGFIIGFTSPDQMLKYNGFQFTEYNNQWTTEINNQEYTFIYHPIELEHINLSPQTKTLLNTPQIYLTFPPNQTNEYLDLARFKLNTFFNQKNIFIYNGALNQTNTLPQITCLNATPYIPVIKLEKTNITQITLKENCLHLSAQSPLDFIKISERLIYTILGVINGNQD